MIITGEMPVDFVDLEIEYKGKLYLCSGTVWVEYDARKINGVWDAEWTIKEFDEVEACDEDGATELKDNDDAFLKVLRNIVAYQRADEISEAVRLEAMDWS